MRRIEDQIEYPGVEALPQPVEGPIDGLDGLVGERVGQHLAHLTLRLGVEPDGIEHLLLGLVEQRRLGARRRDPA